MREINELSRKSMGAFSKIFAEGIKAGVVLWEVR